MTTKQKKKKIQEAHDLADKALKDAQKLYTPALWQKVNNWLYTPLTLSYGQFTIAVLLCVVLLAFSSGATPLSPMEAALLNAAPMPGAR
tara:strand:- start:1258 stop:1524 length:267 start_codon:yes stop_codon:yes gene_type:complete